MRTKKDRNGRVTEPALHGGEEPLSHDVSSSRCNLSLRGFPPRYVRKSLPKLENAQSRSWL